MPTRTNSCGSLDNGKWEKKKSLVEVCHFEMKNCTILEQIGLMCHICTEPLRDMLLHSKHQWFDMPIICPNALTSNLYQRWHMKMLCGDGDNYQFANGKERKKK